MTPGEGEPQTSKHFHRMAKINGLGGWVQHTSPRHLRPAKAKQGTKPYPVPPGG